MDDLRLKFDPKLDAKYTWSSINAGKWETQITALLEIRTIRIQYRNIAKTALHRIVYCNCTIFALLEVFRIF